jgi:hypothetical protein
MDAALDSMTRTKLEDLAAQFHRSRAAVMRQVMHWGMTRQAMGEMEHGEVQSPINHFFFVVDAHLHQDVGKAAKGAGLDVAPYLRHMLREITAADFPRSWQVVARGYRCRFCGVILNAWLPVPKRPDGAMLLGHLSQQHPTELKPYLEQMRTEDIGHVAAQAFEVVEEDGKPRGDTP